MGLDDSDIEKIVEAVKKSKTWKGFNDPKKARNAFYAAFLVAYFGIAVLALGWGITWTESTKLDILHQKLLQVYNKQNDELINTNDLFITNSDCQTLFQIYNELRHDENGLDYTKSLVKDEIAFRCK